MNSVCVMMYCIVFESAVCCLLYIRIYDVFANKMIYDTYVVDKLLKAKHLAKEREGLKCLGGGLK